ncbi:putative short chain dehydrogenase/ reductase [Massariosphaeria phaeospora]|uniref:Putative short chain dehydrogenase/ reductase n=1 Tax=Massariosphaeria phaeospora TaxID=100035 RepID=A0A7C8IM97_9PLEO|nr:putative short chain dehydrogenase/ reductase [Massariosphaeria phaeospora]
MARAKKGGTLEGKVVFVVGGSAGLGKEMAKVMAGQGAHITIFARGEKQLQDANDEICAARQHDGQRVASVAADMSVATTAHETLTAQPHLPDILYCVAGGTPTECGFVLDLEPTVFERCMANNYYSSLYPAQAALRLWVQDDRDAKANELEKKSEKDVVVAAKERKIVFVNSSAALVPMPGYGAYSAAKAAQRALADTLRTECLRYTSPLSTYTTQCIFAHNFITPTFLRENAAKPALTKRIERTSGALADLEKQFPYAAAIAPEIVAAVATGDFAVLDARLEPQLLWALAVGASPRRGWGVVDTVLGWVMWGVWWWVRREVERECRGDAWRVDEGEGGNK